MLALQVEQPEKGAQASQGGLRTLALDAVLRLTAGNGCTGQSRWLEDAGTGCFAWVDRRCCGKELCL